MGKYTDALKSYEEFQAPWETASGGEAEIDKPKLKRFIFNLMSDKAKAQDHRDESEKALAEAEKAVEEAKAEAEKASPEEANKKIAKLEADLAKLKQEKADREKADEREALRKEVIGDLDPKYAKYVQGEDRESLEKSLEAVKSDFGIKDSGKEDDEDDDERAARTRPRSSLRNPTDPDPKGGDTEYDYSKVADEILGVGPFG